MRPKRKKVQQSLDRPWGLQGTEAHRLLGNRHVMVVRLSTPRTCRLYPPPPSKYSWYSFVTGWADPRATVRPEGLCQCKCPVTPSGIEPATSWLVAHCHNQLRHRASKSIDLKLHYIQNSLTLQRLVVTVHTARFYVQDRPCTQKRNVQALSPNHCCRGKAIRTVLHILSACLQPYLPSIQRACAVLQCHLWPAWLYHIFPHYLLNGTIFGKRSLLNRKYVFWYSLQLFVWKFLHF
jgi:hypothetical protein